MSYCFRCATGQLPGALVCRTCCAPLDIDDPAPADVTAPEPAVVSPDDVAAAAHADSVFSSWPFGRADAEAAAQVAARVAAAGVRAQLTRYASSESAPSAAPEAMYADAHPTALAGTHVLASVPGQRETQPTAETYSVPSVGPNPFLAAARMQQAREDAAAEG